MDPSNLDVLVVPSFNSDGVQVRVSYLRAKNQQQKEFWENNLAAQWGRDDYAPNPPYFRKKRPTRTRTSNFNGLPFARPGLSNPAARAPSQGPTQRAARESRSPSRDPPSPSTLGGSVAAEPAPSQSASSGFYSADHGNDDG